MVDHIWDVLSRFFVGNMESFPDTFGQMCAVDNKSVQCRQGLLGCSFPSHLGIPMNNGAEQYTHTKLGLCLYIYIWFSHWNLHYGGPIPLRKDCFFSMEKVQSQTKFTTQPLRHQRFATSSTYKIPRFAFASSPGSKAWGCPPRAGFAAKSLPRRCQVKSVTGWWF